MYITVILSFFVALNYTYFLKICLIGYFIIIVYLVAKC